MASIALVGAGIAGLTAADRLATLGHHVTLFEAAPHVGGNLVSSREAGFLVEHGPNTIVSTPHVDALVAMLGLEPERLRPAAAARARYVVRGGALRALPARPTQLFTSSVLSVGGRLRLLREPFVAPADPDAEETVADFARRRLGREALDYLVDPFVGGIFAGDPAHLSLQHAFPRLHAMEQAHGSLFHALRANTPRPRRPFSFSDGVATLPRAIAERLGSAIRLSNPVHRITPSDDAWDVAAAGTSEHYDGVVYAAPLHHVDLLHLPGSAWRPPLAAVPYPPVSVVALGYPREAVAHALDGFGVLVPAVERSFGMLGAIFSSSLFPGRAPEGHVLLTVLLGGARRPAMALDNDDGLARQAHADVARLLGIAGPPAFRKVVRWPYAIPQYGPHHAHAEDALRELERRHTTLAFAGNYRGGIAVGDALVSGIRAADRLHARFQR